MNEYTTAVVDSMVRLRFETFYVHVIRYSCSRSLIFLCVHLRLLLRQIHHPDHHLIVTELTWTRSLYIQYDKTSRHKTHLQLYFFVFFPVHDGWEQVHCLANAKTPYGCSVLCLRPKRSLCSCPRGPHYGRIVVFFAIFYGWDVISGNLSKSAFFEGVGHFEAKF